MVFLEMFLYSSWFVREVSSCMYLLQPEICLSAISMPHCVFSFFIIFFPRVLYIYLFFCWWERARYKTYVINMLCMHACLFIHIQQLTNFYEILFEFYANGGSLRRHTNSVWNIAYKNRRLYPINFKCRQCMVCMHTLNSSQRENALSTTCNIYVFYIKFE